MEHRGGDNLAAVMESNAPDEPVEESECTNIWESFNKLRLQKQLCDVVIVAGNRRFPVHRAVLAANSPVFLALLDGVDVTQADVDPTGGDPTETPQTKEHSRDVHVKTNPESIAVMVDYIYTRTARITMDNVLQILPDVEEYDIAGLVRLCYKFIESSLSINNCVRLLEFSGEHRRSGLSTECRRYILKNFTQIVARNKEFQKLSADLLVEIISSDDLNVRSEEIVFESIVKWVDHDPPSRARHLVALLTGVRFGLLDAEFYADHVSNHPYVRGEADGQSQDCRQLLSDAWEHIVRKQLAHPAAQPDLTDPLLRPRVPRDLMFIIGGWSNGGPILCIETFDNRAGRFYRHPVLEQGPPRAYHALTVFGRQLYVLGGFDGAQYFNTVRSFDPVTRKWRDRAPMYYNRCYLCCVVLNDAIYAMGGFDGRRRLRSAERFDELTNQWSRLADMVQRRSDAGATVLRGKVYVAGGFNGDQCLVSAEVYSADHDQWTTIEPMAWPRSGVAVTAYRDNLYALGGFDGERRLITCERYCPWTRTWEPVADMGVARSNLAIAVLDDFIYAVGGFDGSSTIASVERYDGDAMEWQRGPDMNVDRSAVKACVVHDLTNIRDFTCHGMAHVDV